MPSRELLCDGCGQPAGQEHIARRLKRLENMTRYRPIHVQALFLGAASPAQDADHLYSADGGFHGEGAALLRALGMELTGRSVETVLTEFQRRGYLLTHLLECPGEWTDTAKLQEAAEKRLNSTLTKIRRSFKPKKVVLLGPEMDAFCTRLENQDLGAELLFSASGRSFRLDELAAGEMVTKLTTAASPV